MLPKNVLLLTIDCLRADRLGGAGYHRPLTPNIDRLVDKAFLFKRAFATGPRTAESFPAILASTYPLAFGGYFNLPPDLLRLAQALAGAGFRTAAFHSNPFLSVETGYAEGFEQFWDSREKTPATSRIGARVMPWLPHSSRPYRSLRRLIRVFESQLGVSHYARAGEVTRRATGWLEGRPAPFFLWLHYMDMHYPFNPPAAHLNRIRPGGIDKRRQSDVMVCSLEDPSSLEANEVQVLVDLYDAGLSYVDENVSALMAALGGLGFLEDTLLVLTGDHGEEFREHGDFGHGALIHERDGERARIKLYDELLHVPLIVKAPWIESASNKITSLVSLVDLPPTILDLLGLPIPAAWQGLSLVPLIRGEAGSVRPGAFSEYALREGKVHRPIVSYRTERWKYIHDGAFGNHELYDLESDPSESSNQVGSRPEVVKELQAAVEEHLLAIQIGERPELEVEMSAEMAERLKALGYLE